MSQLKKELVQSQGQRVIERLAFPSGGSRYIFLLGAHAALHRAQILPQVKEVAGNSAGAIVTTMIALGAHPNHIYKKYGKLNPSKLFGEWVGSLYGNEPGFCALTRDGRPLVSTMQQIVVDIIREFFKTEEAQAAIKEDIGLTRLAQRFQEEEPVLYLEDISRLREFFPEHFKEPFYGTVICPTGVPYVLNGQTAKKVDCARATYASAAIPAVLQPEVINDFPLLDGGTFGQMPFYVFPEEEPLKTLVFAFTDPPYAIYEDTSLYKALYRDDPQATDRFYEPNILEGIVRDRVMPWAVGLNAEYKNTEAWNENYAELAEKFPLSTVQIDACGLLPPDFASANKYSREYFASGFLDTMHYLTMHELSMSECQAEYFYYNLNSIFENIYCAVLSGAGKDVEKDPFWIEYVNYSHEKSAKDRCIFIHNHLKTHVNSLPAKVLGLSVEFSNQILGADELFNEVYKISFEQSGLFKSSKLLGYEVNTCGALARELQSFSIFNNKFNEKGKRTASVLYHLGQIAEFSEHYNKCALEEGEKRQLVSAGYSPIEILASIASLGYYVLLKECAESNDEWLSWLIIFVGTGTIAGLLAGASVLTRELKNCSFFLSEEPQKIEPVEEIGLDSVVV